MLDFKQVIFPILLLLSSGLLLLEQLQVLEILLHPGLDLAVVLIAHHRGVPTLVFDRAGAHLVSYRLEVPLYVRLPRFEGHGLRDHLKLAFLRERPSGVLFLLFFGAFALHGSFNLLHFILEFDLRLTCLLRHDGKAHKLLVRRVFALARHLI